jgi:hypothetical protein
VTDTDRKTAEAIVRKLHEHGAGNRADALALEIIALMRGFGWRPTPATAGAPPMHAPPVEGKPPREELIHSLRMRLAGARDSDEQDGAA